MGATPSKETVSLFSYFRGSYEVGLIPLTKHFFGRVCEGDQPPGAVAPSSHTANHSGGPAVSPSYHSNVPPSTSGACPPLPHTTRAQLRAQLMQMRQDPAVRYSNARDDPNMARSLQTYLAELVARQKDDTVRDAASTDSDARLKQATEEGDEGPESLLAKHYWDIMPNSNFTEDDLDIFLELVERALYESDEAMVNDATYVGDASASVTSPEKENTSALTSVGAPSMFIPIPCVLCLAYPEGKERQGCFSLDGRNINIIGFFGCLTLEMQEAFKVAKQRTVPGAPPVAGKNTLYLNTAILTSAGDRTLERVLVLAAVMLRQQYHAAARRVMLSRKLRSRTEGTSAALADDAGSFLTKTPPQASHLLGDMLPMPFLAPSDPLLSLPLPPLPQRMFTLSTSAYAQAPPGKTPTGMVTVAGAQGQHLMDRGHFFRSNAVNGGTTLSLDPPLPHIPQGLSQPPFAAGPNGLLLSTEEEDAITWGFCRRLERICLMIESASNNYSSLKSLTENFAFLHCQVLIGSSEAEMFLAELPDLPCSPDTSSDKVQEHPEATSGGAAANRIVLPDRPRNRNPITPPAPSQSDEMENGSNMASSEDLKCPTACSREGPQQATLALSPTSSVRLHLQGTYFRQAVMWASCLFHYPARLPGGQWVQYKLKDECDHLRYILQNKDMLIAQWRKQDSAHANSYLGPHTTRVLAHVRALQEETERVRSLPLSHWEKKRVFINHDGRKYALHHSPYGTMLIGIRAHNGNSSGSNSANRKATVGASHANDSLYHRGSHQSQATMSEHRLHDPSFHAGNFFSAGPDIPGHDGGVPLMLIHGSNGPQLAAVPPHMAYPLHSGAHQPLLYTVNTPLDFQQQQQQHQGCLSPSNVVFAPQAPQQVLMHMPSMPPRHDLATSGGGSPTISFGIAPTQFLQSASSTQGGIGNGATPAPGSPTFLYASSASASCDSSAMSGALPNPGQQPTMFLNGLGVNMLQPGAATPSHQQVHNLFWQSGAAASAQQQQQPPFGGMRGSALSGVRPFATTPATGSQALPVHHRASSAAPSQPPPLAPPGYVASFPKPDALALVERGGGAFSAGGAPVRTFISSSGTRHPSLGGTLGGGAYTVTTPSSANVSPHTLGTFDPTTTAPSFPMSTEFAPLDAGAHSGMLGSNLAVPQNCAMMVPPGGRGLSPFQSLTDVASLSSNMSMGNFSTHIDTPGALGDLSPGQMLFASSPSPQHQHQQHMSSAIGSGSLFGDANHSSGTDCASKRTGTFSQLAGSGAVSTPNMQAFQSVGGSVASAPPGYVLAVLPNGQVVMQGTSTSGGHGDAIAAPSAAQGMSHFTTQQHHLANTPVAMQMPFHSPPVPHGGGGVDPEAHRVAYMVATQVPGGVSGPMSSAYMVPPRAQ